MPQTPFASIYFLHSKFAPKDSRPAPAFASMYAITERHRAETGSHIVWQPISHNRPQL